MRRMQGEADDPTPHLSDSQVRAYLEVLGVRRAAPSHGSLCELVRAQVTRVPFENISKLLYRRRLGLREVPDLELYLDGIREHHLGGTCYPNGFHFCTLLRALGYHAALCGAAMRSGEDVHVAIMVALAGREWVVDVGYGAPFLAPLPRDAEDDVVVKFGRDRYVLKPRDPSGRSRLEVYRRGELLHGYAVNPAPRAIAHFRSVVRDSFREGAPFMNAVVAIRHSESASVAIHNLEVVRSTRDAWSEERLADRTALVEAIERDFAIPSAITHEAITGLELVGDVYA